MWTLVEFSSVWCVVSVGPSHSVPLSTCLIPNGTAVVCH
jgi:hypothetical protein